MGHGRIGKTAIAEAIFKKLATQFSSRSIVLNVQQQIERVGVDNVKSQYLLKLLGEDITSSEYNFLLDTKLKRTKGLIVFDDVKDADQLKDLIGTHRKFGEGSRIIVTSRDRQVLINAGADKIYQVSEMNSQDSLQLFHSFAFKQNHPKDSFVSLTEKVLDYAKGLPLALKVLGSLLYGKANEEWESQLQKLEKFPDRKIFSLSKLSYDGLDDEQKDIFLDIACFHRGELEKDVALTLDSCGLSAKIGMDVLKDRGLISISKGRVWMHDLIKGMGHEIVRLQCVDDPGKRSRLWKASDIYNVLRKNKGKGTRAIRGIFLNIGERKKVQLDADTFKKMHNLRMINFYNQRSCEPNVTFNGFLESFPNALKFLRWDGFPQRSLPREFCPENLVILDMPNSHLEQLWEGDQALPNLERLNLSYSKKLVGVPDLSLSPNIEEINLRCCESLVQVYSSSFLDNLNWLCLEHCTELKSLNIPSNILSRSSGFVALGGCDKLETLLISSRTDVAQSYICSDFYLYRDLEEACFYNDAMKLKLNDEGDYEILECKSGTVVTSINELCWLDISNCESLTYLPTELFNLKFLRRLCLRGCLKLEVLPEIEETMENLKVLILDKTTIKELPSSLGRLARLEELSLLKCIKLKTIPSSIGNLSKLFKLNLTYCESLETFPSSIFKLKLTELDFDGCSMLRTFPEILEPAKSFVDINLTETAIEELPSSLYLLIGLEELSLRGCTKLKTIPSSIGNLGELLKLDLTYCKSLETFPSSIFKLKLTELDFKGCSMLGTFPEIPNDIGSMSSVTKLSLQGSSIVNLPESMANLSSLKSLDLTDCKRLECVPNNIGRLSSLTKLSLRGSSIVNLPESMVNLSSLKSLDLIDCKRLECVPNNLPKRTHVFANKK